MAFRDIVDSAKKNTPQRSVSPSSRGSDLIGVKEMGTGRKGEINVTGVGGSGVAGFGPRQGFIGGKSSSDPRHGSIVRKISQESDLNSQMETNATWQECKYRKEGFGRDYCQEYHSLCYKEKCARAKR